MPDYYRQKIIADKRGEICRPSLRNSTDRQSPMNTAFGGHIPSRIVLHDAPGRARSNGMRPRHLAIKTSNAYLQHRCVFQLRSHAGYQRE